MRVLITGGAGFIGAHLARRLVAASHQVTLMDNFSTQIHGADAELSADLKESVSLVRGDVRDSGVWERALAGQDAVVHFAAETGTGQSMYAITQYEQVNIGGTALLYDHLVRTKHHVERIVVASSRAIYGEGAYRCARHGEVFPGSRPVKEKKRGLFDPVCPDCGEVCVPVSTPETAPLQPSSFYGLSKQAQEQMALLFGTALGIPTFALRYQNVYGPGQSLKNPYTGILAVFANLAREGKEINVFEDGLESRDFVYIDDVVNATMLSLLSASRDAIQVNIGSGKRTTVLEVANAVNRFFGSRSKITVSGVFREGDIRHGSADLSRAESLIGYKPKWEFEDGLRQFLLWATQSEPEVCGYERSLLEMKERGLLHGA